MTTPSPEEFEQRARNGDADAQYALSAIFVQRNRADIALEWLNRAAAQGHADALFTLACHLLTTTEGSPEHRTTTIAALDDARARGSLSALRMLAALTAAGLAGDEGWAGALLMMREACERGEPAAMREIAAVILSGAAADIDGEALLVAAARRDPLAGALISRRKRRGVETRAGDLSIDRAFTKFAPVADRGARIDLSAAPRIVAFRGVFGVDLCDHLMGAALPRLKRELVLGIDGQRRVHPHRTAWGAPLGFGFADFPAVYAGLTLAHLAQLPYVHGEPLSILRYLPGQEYRLHHDFLGPNDPDLTAHGQRMKTALLYLNDGYEGGETHFVEPDIKVAGKTGDVVVFDNVKPDGAPDYSVRHAGREITKGEKWLASLWLRDRPFSG